MTPQEKIKQPGVFMMWLMDSKTDPFDYFEKKYGYKPRQIAIGLDVEINVPDGIEIVDNVKVQDKHIKLR